MKEAAEDEELEEDGGAEKCQTRVKLVTKSESNNMPVESRTRSARSTAKHTCTLKHGKCAVFALRPRVLPVCVVVSV